MGQARPLNNLSKRNVQATRVLLVSIPLVGICLYYLFFRKYTCETAVKWYYQLLLFVVLYVADVYLHELIHGFFYKIFNPHGKLHFRFGVLGSSCGMDNCSFKKWQFILMVASPALTLFLLNLLLGIIIKELFACFYFISIIGLTSGSNDFILVGMTLRNVHKNEVIADCGKSFEIISE